MAITFEKLKTIARWFGVEFICDQEKQTCGFEGVAGLSLRNAIEYLQLLLQQIHSSEAIYTPKHYCSLNHLELGKVSLSRPSLRNWVGVR
jgi:hypothetical protein